MSSEIRPFGPLEGGKGCLENGLLEVTVRGGVDHHEPESIRIEHAPSGATSIRTG